mgnify:CR=1 FL=1
MPTADRPNIIVFFTDQQRHDSTGVHGNPLELTPNFDRIAARGTHLYNSFTCQPVCAPARSCLQTGLYATNTGVWRNGLTPRKDLPTLAHYFNDAGYHTGYIGKWHLAHTGARPVPRELRGGYQSWLAADALEHTSDAYRCELFDDDDRLVRLPGYRVDGMTDAAIRHVEAHKDRPFFLFLSFLEPHHQNHIDDYPPPDGYRERYTGRWTPPDLLALGGSSAQHLGGYWGMVKRLDEALGRLMDALRSLSLDRRTILLFTSDHACHFKTRNGEYKRSCHDSSIRVPTALCGPGFDGGGRVESLVSLIDLPPTMLDAAGIAVPDRMEGRSILPLVRRQAADWPREVFVQISESHTGRAIRTGRWKYAISADPDDVKQPSAARYVESHLYDLAFDPHELTNLIGVESHRALADRLRDRLVERMTRAGETAPVIVPAEPKRKGQRAVDPSEFDF